jgi:hypothetical protein
MLPKTDIAKIYETVLSIPGMNENVKIVFNIPRKNVLLLSKVIERGLSGKGQDDQSNVLSIVPKEIIQELQALPAELLEKAGLPEMNQKLQAF